MRLIGLLVLAVVAAGSCGADDSTGDGAASLDTSSDSYLQPGEPLWGDWVVPEGAVAMGMAFPRPDGGAVVEGLVTGNAHQVFGDIYDQAVAAGLRPMSDGDGTPCWEDEFPNWGAPGTAEMAAGYECRMRVADSNDRVVVEARVQIGAERESQVAHVELGFFEPSPDWPSPVDDSDTEVSRPEGESPIDTPPLSSDGLAAGEQLRTVSWQGFDGATVPEDSRLLGPAAPSESNTGGFRYVAEVLGDGKRVSQHYEQLVSEYCWLEGSKPNKFQAGDLSVRYLAGGGAGSGSCEVITATTNDKRTFLLLIWDND